MRGRAMDERTRRVIGPDVDEALQVLDEIKHLDAAALDINLHAEMAHP